VSTSTSSLPPLHSHRFASLSRLLSGATMDPLPYQAWITISPPRC
jgi:hypothetical protein